MWNPVERSSYEAARRSEEGAQSIDEITLAGDEDLPFSPEELAFNDPLDEKARAQIITHNLNHKQQLSLSSKMVQWLRSPRNYWPASQPTTPTFVASPGVAPDGEDSEMSLLKNEAGQTTIVPRWKKTAEQTVSWLVWPLPSYLHRFFVKHSGPEEIRRPTDYLDGMRGLASFIVFIDHYLVGLYDSLMQHGYGEGGHHYNIFELPFLKVIYCGSAMVAVFFVISGYVLAARCIVAMRQNKHDKVYNVLCSMAFRRAIRLFLPSVAITFIVFLCSLVGIVHLPTPHHWTVFGELHRYWMFLMEDLFKLWTWEVSYTGWYGNQLWTIPLEYKCSMILFMMIAIVARCKVSVRFLVEGMTIVYLFYRDRWDVATFIAGMFIAELNIIYAERAQAKTENLDITPEEPKNKVDFLHRTWKNAPLWLVFIFGFYLVGYPISDAQDTPGYAWLFNLWDHDWEYKWRFWIAVGAILLVWSASFLKGAQWFFNTPPIRYLGKISYALYLVHNLTNRTLRLWLWHTFWKVLQWETAEGDDAKYDGGWIIGTLIYFPLVLWFADIVWRAIDVPAVNFARWVETKSFKGNKQA